MTKDTFYFSHDYNARNDEKIKKLIRKHKCLGYGIYWCIVEDLYNNANALELDCDGIAFDLHEEVDIVRSVIFDFDLFVIEAKEFGSTSIERRLNERNEKSKKARKSALYRWNKQKDDANALRTHSDSNAIKERKGKEIKERKEISIINNTSVEQSSTYELILKNSKEISAYIEKEKPTILKPYTDLWNLFATKYGKPKVSETKGRQDKLKVRLKENKFEFVKILINVSKSSDFNLKSKWLNFDWILKSEANYIKILEGNYMQSDFEKAQDEQKQVKQVLETISINSRDN